LKYTVDEEGVGIKLATVNVIVAPAAKSYIGVLYSAEHCLSPAVALKETGWVLLFVTVIDWALTPTTKRRHAESRRKFFIDWKCVCLDALAKSQLVLLDDTVELR
jgi:hypothetical protein